MVMNDFYEVLYVGVVMLLAFVVLFQHFRIGFPKDEVERQEKISDDICVKFGIGQIPDIHDFELEFVKTVAYEEQKQAFHQHYHQEIAEGIAHDFDEFFFQKDADGDYVLIGAREAFEVFQLGAAWAVMWKPNDQEA